MSQPNLGYFRRWQICEKHSIHLFVPGLEVFVCFYLRIASAEGRSFVEKHIGDLVNKVNFSLEKLIILIPKSSENRMFNAQKK